jgi:Protein of unknown function (DUF3726)
MRVSQFEIYRLVQRALEGSGAPYGVDRDGAQAAAWLESRGLPALRLLLADLPGLEGSFQGLKLSGGEIDAAGRSAIAYASAVIDLARGRPALRLRHCRSPLFLLPAATAVPGLSLAWRRAAGAVFCRDGFLHGSEAALLDAAPADIEIRAGGMVPANLPVFLGPPELARRYGEALQQGVEVEDDIWRRIGAVAQRVQVPASTESRLKGAGGGDANL